MQRCSFRYLQIVTPAAKGKALTTTAQVMSAAVSEMHSKSAVVLVFVNQSTTSKERSDPTMAASSVLVSLTKVDGRAHHQIHPGLRTFKPSGPLPAQPLSVQPRRWAYLLFIL